MSTTATAKQIKFLVKLSGKDAAEFAALTVREASAEIDRLLNGDESEPMGGLVTYAPGTIVRVTATGKVSVVNAGSCIATHFQPTDKGSKAGINPKSLTSKVEALGGTVTKDRATGKMVGFDFTAVVNEHGRVDGFSYDLNAMNYTLGYTVEVVAAG